MIPPATDRAAEMRRVLTLAWPVMLTSLNWTLMQVTDVAVVGLAGTDQVAAFGASRTLSFVAVMMGLGWLSGILVFAARADGSGDSAAADRVLREGLVLAATLGLAIALPLYHFALPLLDLVGVAPDVAPGAAQVVRVIAIAYPFQLATIAASFFLEGVSRPRRVMVVNLATLPLNGVLAWAWSSGHMGLPALGAVGAANATLVSSIVGAVAMIAAALTRPGAGARGIAALHGIASAATVRGAVTMLAFGIVPAIASGLELGGFSILIALSTQLGTEVAHAFQIVFAIHNITYGIAIGFGSAAGVRAGNAVGEGRAWAAIGRTRIAAILSALATATLAGGALLIGHPLIALFPAGDAVHALAGTMLTVWVPFIVCDGVQVVFVYALRSLGDQRAAGINSIIAYFLLTGGGGIAMVHAGIGPMALVWASGLGMVAAVLLNGGRLVLVGRRLAAGATIRAADPPRS